jgi:hypothetical protein
MMKNGVGTATHFGADVLMSAAEDAGSIMTDLIDDKQKLEKKCTILNNKTQSKKV